MAEFITVVQSALSFGVWVLVLDLKFRKHDKLKGVRVSRSIIIKDLKPT